MGELKVQLASIFRRGGHKQELLGNEALPEQQELSRQLQQLAVVWALPKAKRGVGAAVWRPLIGAFEVIKRGSHQFNGQGFRRKGQLYLNIEEAVFLLDQCSLLLLLDDGDGQQQLLSMQEALHMMVQLGVSQDRLQVLSHLCRLGFHVKRHPACWLVSSDDHPATSWQTNPAWQNADGLPLLLQQPDTAAAAAAEQPDQAINMTNRQQQSSAAMMDPPVCSRKKRRVDAAVVAAAAVDLDTQRQQQQQGVLGGGSWWDAVPSWLVTSHQQQQQRQQQQEQQCMPPMLLGHQLQQEFTNLRPLQTYQPACLPQTAQQQQQQRQQQRRRRCQAICGKQHVATHEMVYDVLPVDSSFSHYKPPQPQFSIAMPQPECESIPLVDELLHLAAAAASAGSGHPAAAVTSNLPASAAVAGSSHPAAAAAAAATTGFSRPAAAAAANVSSHPAAAGGGGVSGVTADKKASVPAVSNRNTTYRGVTSAGVGDTRYKGVMFGLPSGGDVNFYELRPIQLMNMLTNEC